MNDTLLNAFLLSLNVSPFTFDPCNLNESYSLIIQFDTLIGYMTCLYTMHTNIPKKTLNGEKG